MIVADESRNDDLGLQLTGLVLVRAMLEVQGASPAELTEEAVLELEAA